MLRHCWGSEAFLKLTTDKFNDFLNGIPFKDLPETFSGAHFGHYGAIWKCTSLFASQALPSGSSSGPGVNIMLRIEDRTRLGQWWAGVVRRSSAAGLTFSKDKLVALPGIARRM
jgi:hypothetical protein